MRRSLALAIALALVALVMAGCPTDLLSWGDGPAGSATTHHCATAIGACAGKIGDLNKRSAGLQTTSASSVI